MSRQSGSQRGQAVIEMSLGLLVFVTVLVFGIHFAEVGYVSLKVQEAGISAVWDATAQRMHVPTGPNYGVRSGVISGAGGNALGRYSDFDGRQSAAHAGTLTQVFTQGTGMSIACGAENLHPMQNYGPQMFPDTGGMHCSSEGDVGPIAGKFPRQFVDQGRGGIFKVKMWAANVSNIHVCGLGRASGNSSCSGQYFIMTDDWGLLDGTEAADCELGQGTCTNADFWNIVNARFAAAGKAQGSAASTMARDIVGSSPIDENQFWLSSRGEDSPGGPYKDPLTPPGEGDPPQYHSTPGEDSMNPGYAGGWSGRAHCFLGLRSPPLCLN